MTEPDIKPVTASTIALAKLQSIRKKKAEASVAEDSKTRTNIPQAAPPSLSQRLTLYATREEATSKNMVRICFSRAETTARASAVEVLNNAKTTILASPHQLGHRT